MGFRPVDLTNRPIYSAPMIAFVSVAFPVPLFRRHRPGKSEHIGIVPEHHGLVRCAVTGAVDQAKQGQPRRVVLPLHFGDIFVNMPGFAARVVLTNHMQNGWIRACMPDIVQVWVSPRW